MWQPGGEGSLGEDGYMCVYDRAPLLSTWNSHNIVCKSAAAAAAKSLQLCPTLSDLMDYSLPGSSVHGIFQARVLEWGAIAFSIVNWLYPYKIKSYKKKSYKWALEL